MMDFLAYEGKAAIALLVFYLFYRFLLKKETFHRLNRAVLVGTAALSFVLPLCIITFHRPMELVQAVESAIFEAEAPMMDFTSQVTETPAAPWWPVALAVLFWAGVAFVLVRVAISIFSILRIVRQGELVREEDGCKIIVTERDIDPFSWMHYIVLSRKDWEGENAPILTHEKAHIGFHHSAELLAVDLMAACQWFNPAIWMIRADLQELHEYEADDAVLRAGTNLKEYQYLLIKKAVSKSGYSVANSFNHSILKNRITMMSKTKTPQLWGLRALYVLPLVCLAIGLQARTVYVPVDKDSENILPEEKFEYVLPKVTIVKYAPASVKEEDIIHVNNVGDIQLTAGKNFDTAPVCSENFGHWLTGRLLFPNDCLYDGTLVAMFVVGDDGKVGDVTIITSLCEELDKVVTSQIEKSPAWTPAMKDGKPVSTVLFQPVRFMLRAPAEKSQEAPVIITVRADGKVENGGKEYAIKQLKEIIPPHQKGQSQTTVTINAAASVSLGIIDDVKQELRGMESLKVRYVLSPAEDEVIRYMAPLPPTPTGNPKYGVSEMFPGVNRENIFVVRINSANKIFFGNKPAQDDDEMFNMAKGFLIEHGKDTRFSLQADRNTSFGTYVHMQNLLVHVYSEVRDEKAQAVYGRSYKDLTVEEKSEINFQVPMSISEAEMKNRPAK